LLHAASFAGNARAEISDSSGGLSWNTNVNQLTVECWFKVAYPSGVTPSANMTLLVNRIAGSTNDAHAYHFWYDKDAHNVQFTTKGTTGFWQGVLIGRIQLERLYHVAVTRNGTSLKAYVDGRLAFTTNVYVGDCRSTNGVSIGGWGADKYLYGEVQEVAIYRRELQAAEIFERLYEDQRSRTNLLGSLWGYYKLGYSTNSGDHYRNFAPSPPAVTGAAVPAGSTGQILFEETNQKGEQSLFDSQVNGGKNAINPLSGAFAWQQSVFSRPVPGVPFDFTIGYSPGAANNGLGPGWNHSLASRVITKGSTLEYKLINWQGGIETWERPSTASNAFTTSHGEYRGEFKALPSAEVEWTTPQRVIYRFREPGNPEEDTMAGRLVEIRDLNGNALTLHWAGGLPHRRGGLHRQQLPLRLQGPAPDQCVLRRLAGAVRLRRRQPPLQPNRHQHLRPLHQRRHYLAVLLQHQRIQPGIAREDRQLVRLHQSLGAIRRQRPAHQYHQRPRPHQPHGIRRARQPPDPHD
jgi:hypothetical protein